jgi:hypothetical protein
MPKKQPEKSVEIEILQITEASVQVGILGTTPLIFNRMSEKAKRELLMPRGRRNRADRAASLKHVPLNEYQDSVYRNVGDSEPTRLMFPAPAFKGAIMTAAVDLPGVTRTEIQRLTWVKGSTINIYGVPKMLMSVVRSADIAKTPDMRTRAIVPFWACELTLAFVRPQLTGQGVAALLAAAGVTCGIGDFRQEKGKGNHGQFMLVDPASEEFQRIVATGGREAQDAALENPEYYDQDTEDMVTWWNEEFARRGIAA